MRYKMEEWDEDRTGPTLTQELFMTDQMDEEQKEFLSLFMGGTWLRLLNEEQPNLLKICTAFTDNFNKVHPRMIAICFKGTK
jgi:hypothetical protein